MPLGHTLVKSLKFYSCNVGEVASVVDFFQRRLEHYKLLCRCCSLMGLDLSL